MTEEKVNSSVSEAPVQTTQSNPAPKKRRFSAKHLSIIPNACTSMNIVCGYISIVLTSHGEFLMAGWMILIANIFDILDGRLARLTSVESRFGAELDSLCDLVSFGVAPAFLVYTRYLSSDRVTGLVITAIFVLCGALRLARFNVTPHSSQDVFTGLPIPAGASILATMTIFELQFFTIMRIPSFTIPFVVLLSAFLMVSTVEYPAMKKTPATSKKRFIGVAILIVVFFLNPPAALFFFTWGYAIYGLFFSMLKILISCVKKLRKSADNKPAAE